MTRPVVLYNPRGESHILPLALVHVGSALSGRRVEIVDGRIDPDPERTVVRRLRAGEDVPGFGHPLYPDGDPRARILLKAAETHAPRSPAVAGGKALAEVAGRLIGRKPNVDFGLVVACRAAGLPDETPLGLFALARSVGWVGHIIEQSRLDGLIRPRARYVGRVPD